MHKPLLILSLFLCSIAATAQSVAAVEAEFLVEGGIEYGGDELLTVQFTNGDEQVMLAGQGGYVGAGGQFRFTSLPPLLIRATIGVKYNTTAADNASISLTRFPVTLMPYYQINEDIRLGVGLSTHQGVQFRGDGYAPDESFSGSISPRIEIGYQWAALTYTLQTYTPATGTALGAGSIGLNLSYVFPAK